MTVLGEVPKKSSNWNRDMRYSVKTLREITWHVTIILSYSNYCNLNNEILLESLMRGRWERDRHGKPTLVIGDLMGLEECTISDPDTF